MKKVILAISALTMTVVANAQEFASFKPYEGNVTTEMGLTGGIFNSDIKLAEGALLRGRYFLTEKSAIRVGLNVTSNSTKENFWKDSTTTKGVTTERTSSVMINLGYEHHFKGTNRLSPYVGGDVLFGFGSEKVKGTDNNGTSYAANYNYDIKSSNFSWGVRAVVGADYYFAKNVYLGVEAGLGFINSIEGKTKTFTQIGNVSNETETKSPGSSFDFSPSIITGVRLGFVL
ncbi:MAG: outer membrane beta-barrel protein [Taibaiella sp.]|nr:outer membrane beta-barrel protein [Taibaiella sp.]